MKKNQFNRFWGFKRVILLSSLILFCFSCQKEEPEANLPVVVNEGITFRDGRLIFKDYATFIDHQKWIVENKSNHQLIVDKNSSLGLKSMVEHYLEGMKFEEDDPKFTEYVAKYPSVFFKESYDNSTLYLLPHSKILCYVANADGIFQIGDQIYRIAQNYIYQTDESKIEMLLLPKDQISAKDVNISLSQPRLESKIDYGNKTENFYNDNRFRIVSSLREYVFAEFWYNEIITNPQKRNWTGVYFRAQLNTKAAIGDGYITALLCPSCFWHSPIYASNDEETGKSLNNYYWGNYQLDMSESYCPAYSRGRLIDDVIEYIYILWGDALESPPTSCTVTHTAVENDPF